MTRATVFLTGGTGYMGRRLIPRLVTRGYDVRALVRPGSEHKLPSGANAVVGNVLDAESFVHLIPSGSIVVHLVGTPRPSPSKAAQFEAIDYVSARECIAAAAAARAKHVVYVSVAQPAPIMRVYVDVRARCESLLRDSALPHTILRPWYVLGPGHRWAYMLIPFYWYWNAKASTRATAQRLGLLTLRQMLAALTWSIDTAADETRLLEVPAIRRFNDDTPPSIGSETTTA